MCFLVTEAIYKKSYQIIIKEKEPDLGKADGQKNQNQQQTDLFSV